MLRTRIILPIIMVIWIASGLGVAGAWNADFRGEYPDNYRDAKWALDGCRMAYTMSFSGPIGLVVLSVLTNGFRHGWTVTCEPIGKSGD
jgi:hypothetical protein